jgi:predicted RNase H-like HicB family nuclease
MTRTCRGCVAASVTREEAEDLIREAIALHIALLREDGEIVPEPRSEVPRVAVTA